MNASKWHRTPILLAVALGAAATAVTACGGSAVGPPVGAPPASRHTAVERAATLNWLAMTNQMWTKDNFAALDRVTVGEARTVYRTEQRHAAGDASPSGRTPFRLTGLSITVPCHGWSEAGEAAICGQRPRCCRSQWCRIGIRCVWRHRCLHARAVDAPGGDGFPAGRRGVEAGRSGERIFRRRAPVACPVRCRSGPGRRRGAGTQRITRRRWPGRWITPRLAWPRRPRRRRLSR